MPKWHILGSNYNLCAKMAQKQTTSFHHLAENILAGQFLQCTGNSYQRGHGVSEIFQRSLQLFQKFIDASFSVIVIVGCFTIFIVFIAEATDSAVAAAEALIVLVIFVLFNGRRITGRLLLQLGSGGNQTNHICIGQR